MSFPENISFQDRSPARRQNQKDTAMRKFHVTKGQRYIIGYDRETGQFVETLVPYAELGPDTQETAEIVEFPEPLAPVSQPMRKAG
jgi:hypothetical protein